MQVKSDRFLHNTLLASLPEATLDQVMPHLVPVALQKGGILQSPGQDIETTYFLEEGICSIVATMQNGTTVEVGLIGREGFVGMPAVLYASRTLNQSVMAIAGRGNQIKSRVLTELCDELKPLRLNLFRAVQGLLVQSSQTSACNRVHQLHERLARWLLMCLDRVDLNEVLITQEFLATMLGTRRSTVTAAAGTLQEAGIIEYLRGRVTIINRKGLEEASCECYRVVHNEYVRLGLFP